MSNTNDEALELTNTNPDNQIEMKTEDSYVDENKSLSTKSSNSTLTVPDLEGEKQERLKVIYGNDYNEPNPHKMGNTRTYLFYKGQPLIVIGPDCKI